MATILAITVDNSDETRTVSWSTMGGTDTGQSAAFGQFPDRTVTVQGTFGGATVTIQGSSDGGTTWFTLHDNLGNPLTYTANGMALVAENPGLIRPNNSAGSGSNLNVYLIGSRA